MEFDNSSTADHATITNQNVLNFNDSSTAGSATITNNSDDVDFNDTSTAGSAIITNNLCLELLRWHSRQRHHHQRRSTASRFSGRQHSRQRHHHQQQILIVFDGSSTAGNAAITNTSSSAVTDFSGSTGPAGDNKLTAGSIAGAGSFLLGANELTVGGNNLSTDVSGVISGTGSLVKVGAGTLTLSGSANLGGTTIDGGTLAVNGGTLKASDTIVMGSTAGSSGTLNIGAGGGAAPKISSSVKAGLERSQSKTAGR